MEGSLMPSGVNKGREKEAIAVDKICREKRNMQTTLFNPVKFSFKLLTLPLC